MKGSNVPTFLPDRRFGSAASVASGAGARQKTIGMNGRIRYGTPLLSIFRHRAHQATNGRVQGSWFAGTEHLCGATAGHSETTHELAGIRARNTRPWQAGKTHLD